MRTLRAVTLLAAVACSLAFAPAPFPRTERRRAEDPTDVAGTWRIHVWEHRGQRDQRSEERFLAKATRETFDLVLKAGGQKINEFSLKLHPTLAPTAFTWSMGDKVAFVGSSQLRRDEWTIVFNSGERIEDRPKDFGGTCEFRFVLRRISR